MLAYSGEIKKDQFVAELKKHQEADRFIKGTYWNGEKGCAVGCSIQSIAKLKGTELETDDHALFEKYGIAPEWLARLEDTLFERLPDERSKSWPVEFGEALQEGSDLEQAKVPIIVMLLEHTLTSMDQCDANRFPEVAKAVAGSKKAVLEMIEAQKSGDPEKIKAARSAGYAAARSAESAAGYAAESAARSAARSAGSAGYAAESAGYAAGSAGSAGYAAESAGYAAGSAAGYAAYEYYADKILEILRGLKRAECA